MIPWFFALIAVAVALAIAFQYRKLQSSLTELRQTYAHVQQLLETQRQTAQELQDGLLRGTEDILLILSARLEILFANPAAHRFFGDSLEGKPITEALRQPELGALLRDAQKVHGEVMERRVEFERRIFHARAVTTASNQFEIVTLRDVTEIQRLERARREMVSNITHELSTPITSIGLLAETLLNVADHEKRKRVRKMAKDIRRETDTLMQLVQEIRDLSLIESGQMPIRLTPAPLLPIITKSLEQLESLAEDKDQSIKVSVPPDVIVLVDTHQIERALKNLLHNAIKFSPRKETITVRVETDDSEAIIAIEDNGPGIPADDLPRVFERFFQVDPARREGTGLGLAIVRHIVRAHGGRVWAESVEGEGSTFFVALSLAHTDTVIDQTTQEAHQPSA